MNKSELYNELYNRYGAVRRARGCFLYTKKGTRVTDLYQEGGRAILGWEGGNAFTMFKNVLSRGQTGSFICEDSPFSRLQKAVSDKTWTYNKDSDMDEVFEKGADYVIVKNVIPTRAVKANKPQNDE